MRARLPHARTPPVPLAHRRAVPLEVSRRQPLVREQRDYLVSDGVIDLLLHGPAVVPEHARRRPAGVVFLQPAGGYIRGIRRDRALGVQPTNNLAAISM